MAEEVQFELSKSFLWQCVTLSEECPFITSLDPFIGYFGLGIITLYAALMLTFFWDLHFVWAIDKLQLQMDYYMNAVRRKVRRVQVDQHRLMTTQERTEKQLKRSQDCTMLLAALRGAVSSDDPGQLTKITASLEESRTSTPDDNGGFWNVDF